MKSRCEVELVYDMPLETLGFGDSRSYWNDAKTMSCTSPSGGGLSRRGLSVVPSFCLLGFMDTVCVVNESAEV
jgi:hypothetical protein